MTIPEGRKIMSTPENEYFFAAHAAEVETVVHEGIGTVPVFFGKP